MMMPEMMMMARMKMMTKLLCSLRHFTIRSLFCQRYEYWDQRHLVTLKSGWSSHPVDGFGGDGDCGKTGAFQGTMLWGDDCNSVAETATTRWHLTSYLSFHLHRLQLPDEKKNIENDSTQTIRFHVRPSRIHLFESLISTKLWNNACNLSSFYNCIQCYQCHWGVSKTSLQSFSNLQVVLIVTTLLFLGFHAPRVKFIVSQKHHLRCM